MSEKNIRNFEQPLKVQGANPESIQCKDCIFRDKTTFEHKGKIIPIGVIKSYCDVYNERDFKRKTFGSIV